MAFSPLSFSFFLFLTNQSLSRQHSFHGTKFCFLKSKHIKSRGVKEGGDVIVFNKNRIVRVWEKWETKVLVLYVLLSSKLYLKYFLFMFYCFMILFNGITI